MEKEPTDKNKDLKEFLSKSVLIPSEETGLEVWGSEKGGQAEESGRRPFLNRGCYH